MAHRPGGKFHSSSQKSSENGIESRKSSTQNKFSNDGSFLEMFKKKMEEEKRKKESSEGQTQSPHSAVEACTSSGPAEVGPSQPQQDPAQPSQKKPVYLPAFVGKRRGNAPVLKTGAVKKQKKEEEKRDDGNKDAWSKYLDEVKKYKSMSCQDEDRTQPLVK